MSRDQRSTAKVVDISHLPTFFFLIRERFKKKGQLTPRKRPVITFRRVKQIIAALETKIKATLKDFFLYNTLIYDIKYILFLTWF